MMDRTTRVLLHTLPLAALFALACALFAPVPSTLARRATQEQEQEESKKETPPANSAIYGRVVYDDTSRPVRRSRVLLVDESGSRPEYNALTDADGAFRIEHVRAGTYFAFVDVPGVLSPIGFVRVAEMRGRGNPDFTEARKFFDMIEVDGKQDTRVTVRARRGAALGGHVTYADGDPAVNVTVNVMRRGPDGRLDKVLTGINITSIAGLKTDDRGVFRVTGLPPGEYVVAVSESAEHGDSNGASGMRDPATGVLEAFAGQQFLMTFYPSATKAKDAAVIKADAGVERSDLDITIPARELHKVGGVVRGRSDKRPVARAKVLIVNREDGEGQNWDDATAYGGYSSHTMTSTDADGRWEFKDIPEGSYTISVKPPDEYDDSPAIAIASVNMNTNANVGVALANTNDGHGIPRRKRGYAPMRRDVQVIESDVSDIAVELNDGGRVSGTVTFESEKRGGSYGTLSLRRVPDGVEPRGSDDSWSTYSPGGQFELAGIPAGKYFVQYNAFGEEGKLYVKSVTWNGRDLLREPLELSEGTSVDGIQVVVSGNAAKLRVRAFNAARRNITSSVVIALAPSDISNWSPYSLQLTCFTDGNGSCEVTAPPGEYRVVTMPASSASGSFEEELKRRAIAAPRVTLVAGATKDFEVTLTEK